jgi:hypothetical protein
MASLNFFIKPQSPELMERTRIAYTVRGLAWYITCPASINNHPHALDIAYLLGFSSQGGINWWRRDLGQPLESELTHVVFSTLAEYATRSIESYDLSNIERRIKQFPKDFHATFLSLVIRQLAVVRIDQFFNQLSHSERAIAMQASDKIPKDVLDKLTMSLASLEAALLSKDPMMPQHLRASHQLLVSYPETVHLLDDNEIARLIDAAEIHTKTQIIKDVATKGTGGKKKVTAADL